MAEANALTDRQREYREVYLRSDHWRWKRRQALARAEHRCQVCYSDKNLDVHHRTYERLGEERLPDLTVLCRDCHETFHGSGRRLQHGEQKRVAGELSQRSIDEIRQAVPEPQVMWLQIHDYLQTAPWCTAREVADAVWTTESAVAGDWAYRILVRACLEKYVQRRDVTEGNRHRVQWALADPPKQPARNRRLNSKKRKKAAAKKRKQPRKGDLARDLAEMKQRNERRAA
jgi:hypothetical protein